MPNPPSTTGRLLDDDMPPPFGQVPRPRPTVVPAAPFPPPPEPQRLSAPQARATAPAMPLQPAQRACYEALGLALQEGHVFAAVTGPEGSGKTTVLEAVLADKHDRALRCIRISDPDKVPARLAAQIEQVAYAEAGKPENLERHVVLAIDDAHTASPDLLRCLARLASMREPGRRVPQVLLVARPELWTRLATEEYAPLARRLAIRAVLPALQDEQDPWASLEQEVSQTMSQVRAETEHLPQATGPNVSPLFDRAYGDHYPMTVEEAGLPFDPATVPPPTDYALFPDAVPQHEPRRRESKRRLLLPLGCLMAAVAASLVVVSFYDWPSLFDDMPWADNKPSPTAFVFPQNNQPGMPQTPAWAQGGGSRTPQPSLPRGAPPAPVAAARPAAPPSPPSSSASAAPASAKPAEPAPAAATPPPPAPIATPPITVASAAPIEPSKPVEPPKPAEAVVKPPEAAKPAPTASAEPARPTSPEPVRAASTEPARPGPAEPVRSGSTEPVKPPTPVTTEPAAAVESPKPPATPAPADATTQVAALAAPPLSATAPRATTTPRAAPIAVVKPAPLPPAIVGLLLRRGDEQLAIGDISAARLLFERAAESGNAQGAFRLARTYDPSFLPAADAATLANRNEARIWYGRAASLGDREAAARLRDLNEGR